MIRIWGLLLVSPTLLATPFFPSGSRAHQAASVVRLSDGKALVSEQADNLMTPASVMKVVTSAALLHYWGPSHQIKTPLSYSGRLRAGTLRGDLYVKGSGDPFITSEVLWQLGLDLKHLGLRKITGSLVIDNSLFTSEQGAEERAVRSGVSKHAYDAPVSAFAVNFNTITVAIAPGDQAGMPARVNLDPFPLGFVTVLSRVTTSKRGSTSRLSVVSRTLKNGRIGLTLKGSVPAGGDLRRVYRSVDRTLQVSGAMVRSALKAHGIEIAGKTVAGKVPPKATPLHEIKSKPLEKLVAGLNRFSNNFTGDMLVKRLGDGSLRAGVAKLRQFMRQQVGVKSRFAIHDGSGLDVDNRLTARQITQLLVYMDRRFDLFPAFLAALPAAGSNGTMKKRFASAAGRIRGKTGTMSRPVTVSSIAGFTHHPKHGWLAFAVTQNGKLGKKQPGVMALRSKQDRALLGFLQKQG